MACCLLQMPGSLRGFWLGSAFLQGELPYLSTINHRCRGQFLMNFKEDSMIGVFELADQGLLLLNFREDVTLTLQYVKERVLLRGGRLIVVFWCMDNRWGSQTSGQHCCGLAEGVLCRGIQKEPMRTAMTVLAGMIGSATTGRPSTLERSTRGGPPGFSGNLTSNLNKNSSLWGAGIWHALW